MDCKICGTVSRPVFVAKVLKDYAVQYYSCPKCEFVQTEEPYWLAEAYQSSIALADTGILVRNHHFAKATTLLLFSVFGREVRCLDYAGGYGIFVRTMRDIGFDFTWTDKYTENILARGFEYVPGAKVDVVTAFESFEHFPDPLKDIGEILSISRNVIFSTLLVPNPVPQPQEWWYYVLHHGQHVSFYSRRSLEYLSRQWGLHFVTNGINLHMMSERAISPARFRFLISRAGKMLFPLVVRSMRSKTSDDMASAHTSKTSPIVKHP